MPVYRRNDRYPLVRIESAQDWRSLLDVCDGHLDEDRLEQFQTLLGENCKAVVVERDYVCKDYRDTFTIYYAKKFASYPDKCTRLLFFGKAVGPRSWWNVPSYAGSFIGYSIIRPTRIAFSSLGRTILNPDACAGVQGYVCRTRYVANLMGTELPVSGFPHISQDSDVTVCAHAACWSCFRYFSERYPTYREIYPYQITQLTTDLSEGRLLPSKGLSMQQVVEMFSRFGFYPRIYFREVWDTADDQPFERLLYYYLESGLPLVVGIDPDHAVTAIGHTSDFELALPHGQCYSSGYLTGLVINDDNFMPYQTLPRQGFERLSAGCHTSRYTMSTIDSFVAPLYEKIYLAAEDVERWTLALLDRSDISLAEMGSSLAFEDLVIRIFLTTSRAYKAERRLTPLPHGLSRLYTQLPMPRFVWVSELSTKTLYPQGSIVGEIIWDATASDEDDCSWLVIHYPELLLVNDRASANAGIIDLALPGPEPYELYRHNLHLVR